MEFPEDQLTELKQLFSGVQRYDEGGYVYFLIPALHLPDECKPQVVDALLCPMSREGYPSRLFFSERVTSRVERNWNSLGMRIIERNWNAYSWKANGSNLRLAQMVAAHLGALR